LCIFLVFVVIFLVAEASLGNVKCCAVDNLGFEGRFGGGCGCVCSFGDFWRLLGWMGEMEEGREGNSGLGARIRSPIGDHCLIWWWLCNEHEQ
jgi:hypothetical protein